MWNAAGACFFVEWRCFDGYKAFPSNRDLDGNLAGAAVGLSLFLQKRHYKIIIAINLLALFCNAVYQNVV